MVKGGLGSRHEEATDGYFVAPKIKKVYSPIPWKTAIFTKKKQSQKPNHFPS